MAGGKRCVLVCVFVCVFVEGAVVGEKWSERCRQLSECLAIATATSFPTIYTRLEQVSSHYTEL